MQPRGATPTHPWVSKRRMLSGFSVFGIGNRRYPQHCGRPNGQAMAKWRFKRGFVKDRDWKPMLESEERIDSAIPLPALSRRFRQLRRFQLHQYSLAYPSLKNGNPFSIMTYRSSPRLMRMCSSLLSEGGSVLRPPCSREQVAIDDGVVFLHPIITPAAHASAMTDTSTVS